MHNNTTTPVATLNLLFSAGTAVPVESGLKILKNGVIQFAAGQTFPGASISAVAAGIGLTGGGTSGKVTLSVDATKVPLLALSNAFSQPQVINGGAGGLTVTSNGTAVYGTGHVGVYGTTAVPGGNSNGVLGKSLNATAVRGNDGGGGSGVVGTSISGFGVYGTSSSGTPIYGTTTGKSGITIGARSVVGDANTANGVTGISTSGAGMVAINRAGNSGLAAVNQGSGFGIYSTAATVDKDYGVGIRGESFGTQVSSFGGPDGVQGITHSALGSGVAGINDAQGGIGVIGVSTNSGFGMRAAGNVVQDRGFGGWAKAMVYVDPFVNGGIQITRCYNSQATGAAVFTPPCGINITFHSQGNNILDFGFEVGDRYVTATPNSFQMTITTFTNNWLVVGLTPNQVQVLTNDLGNTAAKDGPFTLIIF